MCADEHTEPVSEDAVQVQSSSPLCLLLLLLLLLRLLLLRLLLLAC